MAAAHGQVTGNLRMNADIVDIEAAILSGTIDRTEKEDPRGTKYVVIGFADDKRTPVGIVGRFVDESQFLIITVYVIT